MDVGWNGLLPFAEMLLNFQTRSSFATDSSSFYHWAPTDRRASQSQSVAFPEGSVEVSISYLQDILHKVDPSQCSAAMLRCMFLATAIKSESTTDKVQDKNDKVRSAITFSLSISIESLHCVCTVYSSCILVVLLCWLFQLSHILQLWQRSKTNSAAPRSLFLALCAVLPIEEAATLFDRETICITDSSASPGGSMALSLREDDVTHFMNLSRGHSRLDLVCFIFL